MGRRGRSRKRERERAGEENKKKRNTNLYIFLLLFQMYPLEYYSPPVNGITAAWTDSRFRYPTIDLVSAMSDFQNNVLSLSLSSSSPFPPAFPPPAIFSSSLFHLYSLLVLLFSLYPLIAINFELKAFPLLLQPHPLKRAKSRLLPGPAFGGA